MAISHEVDWVRRGVRDGFQWAGTRMICRQVWTVYDYEQGLVSRCPECYDEVLKQVSNTRCESCYGTGFAGGYKPPMVIWASIAENVSQNRKHENAGIRPESSHQIRLPTDMDFHDGDVFAEIREAVNGVPTRLGKIYMLNGPVDRKTVQGWVSNNRFDPSRDTVIEEMVVSQAGTVKPLLPTDFIYDNAYSFFDVRSANPWPKDTEGYNGK